MNAEIIAVGDEIASGQRVDTNSAWLGRQLEELGIQVLYHTTVADDLAACRDAFAHALRRADVVVATGGLGPTADDLTRPALAAATACPLQLNATVLAGIRTLFASRGREMPPQNETQAMFPLGSRVIPNPHGTAPGIAMQHPSPSRAAHCFALPGVPAEMKEMWNASVRPMLEVLNVDGQTTVHHELKCFGVGESDLESRLPDLIRRGRMPSVGITVHRATITLRITTKAESRAACHALMEPTIQVIRQALGPIVFGEGDEELQHVVTRLLAERRQSVAVCEWGTPGLLACWLREAAADSACFAGGIVIGSTAQLPDPWNQRRATRRDASAEEDRVRHLAETARRYFQADFGLSVGPFPEAAATDPEALLLAGLAHAEGVEVFTRPCAGHPDIIRERSAKQSLNDLRLRLLAVPLSP